eukprot:TRINITY_DN3233_c3_g1_i1.p2 TRINITY_DN3233_c3_g1~~TRINITY_DN3233_c3_g1_i1.p2  ORF type:complete len:54 (-),score=3.24 TRINITY_DN3233_c3_g1_i1:135-296(-)
MHSPNFLFVFHWMKPFTSSIKVSNVVSVTTFNLLIKATSFIIYIFCSCCVGLQ